MTLKEKFTWLSAAAVALVALAGIQNARALDTLVAAAERQEGAARVIRAHMHADMMHDALHADVLKALFAHEKNDAAMIETAAAEARADGAALAEDIATALSHNPPADITGELQAVRGMVSGYAQAAAELIGAAEKKSGAGKPETLLPAFETAFNALKEKNDSISAQLDRWLHGIEEKQDLIVQETKRWNTLSAFLIVLITLGIPVFAHRQVFTPLEKLIDAMKDLSAGRLDDAVTGTERADEVGDISRALAVFRVNAQEKKRLEAETAVLEQEAAALGRETAALKKQAEEDRRRALFGLADNFEANVKSVADTVATAATEMDATSRDVMQRTHDSADKLGLLVSGIAGASQNVQTVAAAAAELSASIHEIAAQVGHGGKIMHAAVAEAGRANEKAESLSVAAERIGSVVDVINDITEQINLLALNATIEAARAGEQGRGFAVVASEVKNLAGQTTAATRQIEEQISFIQSAAAETVAVMQQVTSTISEMNKISASIAAAVEEQGMATQEIARNVQQAAEITKTVSSSATDVRHSAAGTSSAFSQMIAAASDLSRQSESLRGQVGAFLKDIKAA